MADSSSIPTQDITQDHSQVATPSSPAKSPEQPEENDDDDGNEEEPSSDTQWQEYVQGRKRKWAAVGIEERHMDELEGITLSYRMAMMQDQLDVLYPPAPTAFTSTEDALRRLLPYHIYQVHESELEGQEPVPAKQQARREQEHADLTKRIDSIHERVFKLKRREGTHPSSLPPLINIIQSSTEIIRQQTAAVRAQYRNSKAVHDALQDDLNRKRAIIEHKNNLRKEQALQAQIRLAQQQAKAAPRPVPTAPANSQTNPTTTQTTPTTTPKPAIVAPPITSTPTNDASELLPKVQRGRGRPPGSKTTPKPPASTPAPAVGASASNLKAPTPATPSAAASKSAAPAKATTIAPKVATPAPTRPPTITPSTTPAATTPAARPMNSTPSITAAGAAPTSQTPQPANGQTPTAHPNGAGTTSDSTHPPKPTPKEDLPSHLRIATKQLPQLHALGIITIPPDPKAKVPGVVSAVSSDKETCTVIVYLNRCTHTQLTSLANILGVKPATKPEEGAAKPAAPVTTATAT